MCARPLGEVHTLSGGQYAALDLSPHAEPKAQAASMSISFHSSRIRIRFKGLMSP